MGLEARGHCRLSAERGCLAGCAWECKAGSETIPAIMICVRLTARRMLALCGVCLHAGHLALIHAALKLALIKWTLSSNQLVMERLLKWHLEGTDMAGWAAVQPMLLFYPLLLLLLLLHVILGPCWMTVYLPRRMPLLCVLAPCRCMWA